VGLGPIWGPTVKCLETPETLAVNSRPLCYSHCLDSLPVCSPSSELQLVVEFRNYSVTLLVQQEARPKVPDYSPSHLPSFPGLAPLSPIQPQTPRNSISRPGTRIRHRLKVAASGCQRGYLVVVVW